MFLSSEEAALFDMGTNDQNDWPDKRARVKNCFDELKKLLPQGQSLNTVEALETVVAQFKKLKGENSLVFMSSLCGVGVHVNNLSS